MLGRCTRSASLAEAGLAPHGLHGGGGFGHGLVGGQIAQALAKRLGGDGAVVADGAQGLQKAGQI